jgi:serine/threonine-protein kinase
MELLDGEDLGQRLERNGRLTPGQLVPIISQVCRALTKAHQVDIVHRDLKPDNVFLVRDDDREIAKVVDFGIAKLQSTALQGSNTRTGSMLGTPYYMSPEQAQGTKAVDSRSDLWSLAVIVFQCLTGRLPFESEALGDLLVKIIVSPIPMPSQVAPGLPPGLDRWWERAASRDPAGRFQTAKEFSDSLLSAVDQAPLDDATSTGRMLAINALGHTAPGIHAATPVGLPPQSMMPRQASAPVFGQTLNGTHVPGVTKKGTSVGLIVGAGAALLLAGVAVAGVLVLRGRASTDATSGGGSATTTAAAESATSTVTPTSTASVAVSPPQTKDPVAPATATAAAEVKVPTKPGVAQVPVAATATASAVVSSKPVSTPLPVASAKPTVPKAPTGKPDLGF